MIFLFAFIGAVLMLVFVHFTMKAIGANREVTHCSKCDAKIDAYLGTCDRCFSEPYMDGVK